MYYEKEIPQIRSRVKNQKTTLFIDFLETVVEWIDKLVENKRLSREHEKELFQYLPSRLLQHLFEISPTEITIQEYDDLKRVMIAETSVLIKKVLELGDIRMEDFDILQFNLYQIFGKEELASMIEWTRVNLSRSVAKQKVDDEKQKQLTEKEWQDHLTKIRTMPELELRRYIIKNMFDFTPSARSLHERKEALQNNRLGVINQRKIFHTFETKLSEATRNARREAQSNVYTRLGEVKTDVATITKQFQLKAKQFASDEGPKRDIQHAQERVGAGRDRLHVFSKEISKNWERDFGFKVQIAQQTLFDARDKLSKQEKHAGAEIRQRGTSEFLKASTMVGTRKQEFIEDISVVQDVFAKKSILIEEQGQHEITSAQLRVYTGKDEFTKRVTEFAEGDMINAQQRVLRGKKEFTSETKEAQHRFANTEKSILFSRDAFIEKRDSAQQQFHNRGNEIETSMYGSIYKEQKRLKREREQAKDKLQGRGNVIYTQAKHHVLSGRDAFIKNTIAARARFEGKAKSMAGSVSKLHGATLQKGADRAKGQIQTAQEGMIAEARSRQKRMEEEMMQKRDLFEYEVRFANYKIKENAQKFSDRVLDKREEFADTGKTLVARHKAKQKALLTRNLLRTIRGMH